MTTKNTLIYIDIDESLNITETLCGEKIIPSKPYDLFFMDYRYVAETIQNYKVVLVNGKYELEAIDKELEKQKQIEAGLLKSKEQLEQEYLEKLAEAERLKKQLEQGLL